MGRYPRAGWLGAGRTLEPGGERHRTGQQRRARAGSHLVPLAGRDFRAIKGWTLMADLLPAFPAGLWLMAASTLVRITRFPRAFSLIPPAIAIILIRLAGRLPRSGFHAWRGHGRVGRGRCGEGGVQHGRSR